MVQIRSRNAHNLELPKSSYSTVWTRCVPTQKSLSEGHTPGGESAPFRCSRRTLGRRLPKGRCLASCVDDAGFSDDERREKEKTCCLARNVTSLLKSVMSLLFGGERLRAFHFVIIG